MAYQALARKYRPRRFDEVSTQEHVSETLRRAVLGGRVAHAYLFSGPRGVGKTTLARVLAMALNCPRRSEEGEPCGECESCTRIRDGHTELDVVEIDAASNRGVDDARELRSRAMYAPSEEDRYKVYIVDEAHMLTREAWNALLKILEEPPPRVIFVFATTEPQKIEQSAAPILSRCQRFDFRRIGVSDIVDRLQEVLEVEGVDAPEEALQILARKADGGMRDGLSLLDQVLSLTGGEVSLEAVRRILGLVQEERYLDLVDVLREGRHGDVFAFVEGLLDEGYDLVEFYHGLVDVLRMLLRIRLSGSDSVPHLREDVREALAERAESFEAGDLVRMLALASELESTGSLRRSAQPRLLLEMLLLRLSYLDRTVRLEELIGGLGGAATGEPAGSAGSPMPSGTPDSGPRSPGSGPRLDDEEEDRGVAEEEETDEEIDEETDEETDEEPDAEKPSTPLGLQDAWERLLASGDGLPSGMSLFKASARVTEADGDVVELHLPPGPALELLEGDVAARRRMADALSSLLDRRVRLAVRRDASAEKEGNGRVTPETVRRGRLEELVEQEPLLERAVQELDLELLE